MTITYDEMMGLFKETREQVTEQAKTFDRELRESREAFDRKLDKLGKQIGAIGNRLGDFVQDMVQPAVVSLFRERGVEVHEVTPNYAVSRNGESFEVDLMVVNDGDAIAVECKSRPITQDIDEHVKRLDKIRRLANMAKNKRLMGAIAGMKVDSEVVQYAMAQGLYVLAQSGESVVIKNDANFQPTYW